MYISNNKLLRQWCNDDKRDCWLFINKKIFPYSIDMCTLTKYLSQHLTTFCMHRTSQAAAARNSIFIGSACFSNWFCTWGFSVLNTIQFLCVCKHWPKAIVLRKNCILPSFDWMRSIIFKITSQTLYPTMQRIQWTIRSKHKDNINDYDNYC